KKIFSVKEVVFPWKRFPEVDPILGPEMKSTGEVMGIDKEFGLAYYKAQLSAGYRLPERGNLFISVADRDKPKIVELAKEFEKLGFGIYATLGTYTYLKKHGVKAKRVLKVSEGRPNVVDMIINGDINLVINTPSGKREKSDAYYIRRACVQFNVPYYTTVRAGYAVLEAIKSIKKLKEEGENLSVHSLQEIYNI
ncbi:MAG: carbamoyl-phosphate synthase large chain, partial [Aquifex sp.]